MTIIDLIRRDGHEPGGWSLQDRVRGEMDKARRAGIPIDAPFSPGYVNARMKMLEPFGRIRIRGRAKERGILTVNAGDFGKISIWAERGNTARQIVEKLERKAGHALPIISPRP